MADAAGCGCEEVFEAENFEVNPALGSDLPRHEDRVLSSAATRAAPQDLR